MGKPTEQELQEALTEAQRMREQGDDPHHVARALLNLNYRAEFLEGVLRAAEAYLNSGLAEAEHTRLLAAIERARAADHLGTHREPDTLGL